ncbi:MAG: KH domain-containing protein, partial [Candidatus Puniceispirillaceae bacterium]
TKELSEMMDFSRVFMVSADKDKGLDDLLVYLADEMMSGPYLFDPDDLSDLPMRLMAAEVMREKLFLNLHQELPYQLTVETEQWKDRADGSVEIRLTIYVQREGHRGIVLGKGGQTLKRIGSMARQELQEVFDRQVHLLSHVKYRKDWMDDKARYQDWDLDFDA